MIERKYSQEFQGINPQDVWNQWIDVNNWHKWHDDLDYCQMDGKFAVGNFLMLKPKGMKAVKIDITEVNPGLSFTDCTRFPGAKMFDAHYVEATENGVRIKNNLYMTGALKRLWYFLVGRNVADSAKKETTALVRISKETQRG